MDRNDGVSGLVDRLTFAAAMLLCACPVAGQPTGPGVDVSCAYFSADPQDTNGPPIEFYAELSADAQAAPTESLGTARADFVLERDTLRFSWRLSYGDLTSEPVGAHVHAPVAPGAEAAVLFDMAPNGFGTHIEGERILTRGEVAYAVQNLMYVNLHTAKYPAGELRGPVKKARPQC